MLVQTTLHQLIIGLTYCFDNNHYMSGSTAKLHTHFSFLKEVTDIAIDDTTKFLIWTTSGVPDLVKQIKSTVLITGKSHPTNNIYTYAWMRIILFVNTFLSGFKLMHIFTQKNPNGSIWLNFKGKPQFSKSYYNGLNMQWENPLWRVMMFV